MKKPTMIIGRKQIVLSALTLVLGAAVYLNYVLAGGNGLLPAAHRRITSHRQGSTSRPAAITPSRRCRASSGAAT